jgi:serine/threonine protein kinase
MEYLSGVSLASFLKAQPNGRVL